MPFITVNDIQIYYEDRINDAKEEGKLIQNLIVDKFIPSVNQYQPESTYWVSRR